MPKKIDRSILDGDSIVLFRAAIRSKETLDPYERKLISFLNRIRMTSDDYVALAKKEPSKAERLVMEFIIDERKRVEKKEITAGTLSNAVKSVRLLLEMNDVIFNWRKIRRLIPSVRRYALDRIPSKDELRKIVNGADLRGKAMTLVFVASGIREGAVQFLKISDLNPIERDGKIVAENILRHNKRTRRHSSQRSMLCETC